MCALRKYSRVTIFDEQFRKVALLMMVIFDDDPGVESLTVENSLPMRDDGEGTFQIWKHEGCGGLSHGACSLCGGQSEVVRLVLESGTIVPAEFFFRAVDKVQSERVGGVSMGDDEAVSIIRGMRHKMA